MTKVSHIVIGGGAAGVFAAIRCKSQAPRSRVILLEKTNQLLAKVKISGGGRCNVTHACFDPFKLAQNYPRGFKELIAPFHLFQPKDTVAWFEEQGVTLKTEEDGRMFPTSNSSDTIIQCLLNAALQAGVEIRKQQRILSLEKKEDQFVVQLQDAILLADTVLLATGSSGWGYEMAEKFGHKIISPVPSLFTFNVPTSPLLDLSGISVAHVTLTLKEASVKQTGPLLLTHWGFSGPAVLKLSAWGARILHDLNYKATLVINWVPSHNQEELYQSLVQKKESTPKEGMPNWLPNHLLQRLLTLLDIEPKTPLGKLPNKALAEIAKKIHADPYAIEGKTTFKHEFVTAGGVDLKEIDFKTIESRKIPGLFFAGEILNIDGITGGFNFQNAWTTGYLAGSAMVNHING